MIREEQELVVVEGVTTKKYVVSSTIPRRTREIEALERRGLARRRRTITAVENGERKVLGGEWELDEEHVALRLTHAAEQRRRRRRPRPRRRRPVWAEDPTLVRRSRPRVARRTTREGIVNERAKRTHAPTLVGRMELPRR